MVVVKLVSFALKVQVSGDFWSPTVGLAWELYSPGEELGEAELTGADLEQLERTSGPERCLKQLCSEILGTGADPEQISEELTTRLLSPKRIYFSVGR